MDYETSSGKITSYHHQQHSICLSLLILAHSCDRSRKTPLRQSCASLNRPQRIHWKLGEAMKEEEEIFIPTGAE